MYYNMLVAQIYNKMRKAAWPPELKDKNWGIIALNKGDLFQ
jgi:hypothetical protein